MDVSKILMYDFHYDYVVPKYGEKVRLLFTDTDSLCYRIETENFFKDIEMDVPKWFDTSAFPKDHPSGLKKLNKKVLGMMKDEAEGKQVTEFVGLRSKMYAFSTGKRCSKKCKGVKRSVVEKAISIDQYRECLFSGTVFYAKFNTFRSRRHDITTDEVTKVALTSKDDKRFVLPNDPEHKTLAWGHYKLKELSYKNL